MKKLLFLMLPFWGLYSCSYKIARNGYTENLNSVDTCNITITHTQSDIPLAATEQVGSISLKDGGFTNHCSEQQALAILKKEACSVQASIILITSEKIPGFQSTCYQCTANFYKITRPDLITQPNTETKATMPTRGNYVADEPSPLLNILAYTVGFVAGYTLMSLILK